MTVAEVPRSGVFDNGSTSFSWNVPEWSALDYKLCSLGLHIASRRVVVDGWISYLTPVRHLYCACGRKCWIWFDGGIASVEDSEPDGHLHWVQRHIEFETKIAEHRAWERRMSENHPCWGVPYSCISCGCSKDTPCVSHRAIR